MTTSVCTWGKGHIDTTSDKHQDPMYGFSLYPQTAGPLGLGDQVEAREYMLPTSKRGQETWVSLSTDPVALPWSLTQFPHLVPGSGISGLEMSLEPLRHTVRLAPLPNTCENLSQKERGRKVGPGNYIRVFEQKWSWHRCL